MPRRKTPPQKVHHPLELALGARIRELRRAARPKVSQHWLARECGFSYQQMQKYEVGKSRMAFSTLWEVAKALGTTVTVLIAPLEVSARQSAQASPVSKPSRASPQ